ncbi:MAG: hypothetical protein WD851_10530 [Pirellulales bacterium]
MRKLAIIRSELLSPEHIRKCAQDLENRYIQLRFKFWDPDEGRVLDFIIDKLFDVSGFGTVYAVDVWYHASGREEYSKVEAIRSVFDALGVHWRELWKTNERSRGDKAGNRNDRYELSIGCGRSHLGYYCCFDPLDDSPAFKDRLYRKELLQKAISSTGLQENIRVYFDEQGDLRMTAESPLRLTHFLTQANNANPVGFNVNGLESAEQASDAALAMRREIATTGGIGMIRAGLPIANYKASFSQLNELAKGWRISISCERDGPAARALANQDFLQSGEGRYPAFNWWEDTNGPEVIGSVLVEDGYCFLELATEGGGVELLKERARVLNAVKFDIIL